MRAAAAVAAVVGCAHEWYADLTRESVLRTVLIQVSVCFEVFLLGINKHTTSFNIGPVSMGAAVTRIRPFLTDLRQSHHYQPIEC